MTTHHIWHPLSDTPVTVTLSREQLQLIHDALTGNTKGIPAGWLESLAGQVEAVLKASLEGKLE